MCAVTVCTESTACELHTNASNLSSRSVARRQKEQWEREMVSAPTTIRFCFWCLARFLFECRCRCFPTTTFPCKFELNLKKTRWMTADLKGRERGGCFAFSTVFLMKILSCFSFLLSRWRWLLLSFKFCHWFENFKENVLYRVVFCFFAALGTYFVCLWPCRTPSSALIFISVCSLTAHKNFTTQRKWWRVNKKHFFLSIAQCRVFKVSLLIAAL